MNVGLCLFAVSVGGVPFIVISKAKMRRQAINNTKRLKLHNNVLTKKEGVTSPRKITEQIAKIRNIHLRKVGVPFCHAHCGRSVGIWFGNVGLVLPIALAIHDCFMFDHNLFVLSVVHF